LENHRQRKMDARTMLLVLGACAITFDMTAARAGAAPGATASGPVQPDRERLSSVGSGSMAGLMDAWFDGFSRRHPNIERGRTWEHLTDAKAIGGLMFEIADMAPMTRQPAPVELAPYDHQFRGDMMKAPLLVRVARQGDQPAYIAVNKRPGAPLPEKIRAFLAYSLSPEGQRIARHSGFAPLDAAMAKSEEAKLEGYLPTLDPGLPHYRPSTRVSGEISSVGSDGMKSLMDRWQRDFARLQPGARKGERWEHLGTLNGFHALIVGETDIAPMGRELWPQEQGAYQAATGRSRPLEIRVARGGFNTPQRTTAQAIFVHQGNPIRRITVPQLAAIMARNPTITHWGQLGLKGEWANRPINLHTPPLTAPNAMSMQIMVLGGRPWRDVREGSIADTAAAIARDPGAIGFGGFEEGGPGLKALTVAARASGPFYEGTGASVSSGRYPLTRYMYIRLNRGAAGIPAHVAEFLRYILSREGQEPIRYSGYYPLTAAEAAEELAKLN
jgi:ABC-type phosphate transport system substrate-binding protein